MTTEVILQLGAQARPWFSDPGITGAVLGGGVGLMGAVYGTTVGLLVPRARGKRLVFGLHWAFFALGVVLLAAGVTAITVGQPYGVWYPLLLSGGLTTLLMAVFTPVLGRVWYRQAEQRRLDAEEFRRG